ncbi:conjugal transfer protein TraD [Escherichia coli]|nr:conjugal transfer protein TraD [Escherichia coli]
MSGFTRFEQRTGQNSKLSHPEKGELVRNLFELYKAAGLMIVAGLVDSKTGKPKFSAAELVGALAGIAELPHNHPKWQEWEKRGKELLTKDSA